MKNILAIQAIIGKEKGSYFVKLHLDANPSSW